MNNIRPQRHRTAKFFAIRQILGLSVSPNGKTIAFITNTDGLPNIWTIPITGGWASQVTLAENAVKSPILCNSASIYVLKDINILPFVISAPVEAIAVCCAWAEYGPRAK